MKHPRGVILDELSAAGVPTGEVHEIADRIMAAYEEQNPAETVDPMAVPVDPFRLIRPGWPGLRFDLVEAHEAAEEGETP